MNATIYIRKENEEKWNNIHDKSVWINTILENSDNTREYGKAIETPVGPSVVVLSEKMDTNSSEPIKTQGEAQKAVKNITTLCKHGYHPLMCKFSKNGKPCRS